MVRHLGPFRFGRCQNAERNRLEFGFKPLAIYFKKIKQTVTNKSGEIINNIFFIVSKTYDYTQKKKHSILLILRMDCFHIAQLIDC